MAKHPAKKNQPGRSTPGPQSARGLQTLIALGLLTRIALAACSVGTNDAVTFLRLGAKVSNWGLLATYQEDRDMNHPPIAAYWAAAVFRLTNGQAVSNPTTQHADVALNLHAFSFVLKVPSMLADGLAAWLIYKIVRKRFGPRRALGAAALYAWCLDAILVSGYHCNTDPVYAFLCLLCVWLMAERRWYFLGGLALGAAVNVKLTPILLAAPLLLNCRNWKQAGKFVAGLALGALPFLPILLGPVNVREAFRNNALAYNSNLDKWGIEFFLLPYHPGDVLPPPADYDAVHSAGGYYNVYGRYVILALIGAWSIVSRVLRRWDLYEVAAVTLALFLVFASGFGVQYTCMVLPLLFAIRPRLAAVYGTAAGLFLLAVYFITWTGEFPLFSIFHSLFPMPSPYFGVLAWATLIAFVAIALARPAPVQDKAA